MPRTTQTVFSEGIFHGLPTFPDHDGKKYTAIVTGANGISGSEIVDVLASSPEIWETIYAMSRKPPVNKNPHVKTIAADFLSSTPEELAALFKKEGIKADYIFFNSYLQPPLPEAAGIWTNTEELDTVNVTLLSNFLSALEIANVIPKRIILQTGGKHYALHLGPTAIPMYEGTPSTRVPHSNFYFPQEDLLTSWSTKHNSSWVVTRPGFILGANKTAFINITYGLALYASIQKALGKPLEFPADIAAWDVNKDNTTARLIGYFAEWVALTEHAGNGAFNIVDDSPFSYGTFWPEVAGWYGLHPSLPELDDSKYTTITLPRSPPPRGFGPAGSVKITFSFEAWAKSPEVKAAWEVIREREGLDGAADPWGEGRGWMLKDVFGALDAEVLGGWARTMSMDKAKQLGWHGFVRTRDGFRDTIVKMAGLKMVPGIE